MESSKLRVSLGALAAAVLAGCASANLSGQLAASGAGPVQKVTHGGAAGDVAAGQAYAALARDYEAEGLGNRAIETWRKAIAEDPSNAGFHYSLGVAQAAHQRHADAVLSFARADVFAPNDARTLNSLGYSQLMAGQHRAAVGSLEQALRLEPQYARARANLDAARAELAREERATVRLAGGEQIGVPAVWTRQSPVTLAQAAELLRERVTIVNGNGVAGAAGRMRDIVRERGVIDTRLANLPRFDAPVTQVIYREGYSGYARQVARRLPLSSEIVAEDVLAAGNAPVRVVIGHDARVSAACLKLGGCLAAFELSAAQAAADTPIDIALR